jgi:hypothetical protein
MKNMQELLEMMRQLQEPGVAVDVSIDLIKRFDPAERETFVRKMMEDGSLNDLSSEQRELIVHSFLELVESGDFESFAAKSFGEHPSDEEK